jgi:hypothetical protein
MLYTTLLRHLYIHKYQFTFLVNENIELPVNFIQYLSDGFKKALDDVAKDKESKYHSIRNTYYNFLYTGMHFPETLIEQPGKKNINTPNITTEHSCYQYLKNYPILPWWIQPVQTILRTKLSKKDTLSFNFYLCGEFNHIWQNPIWFDVLFKWTTNGLGIPGLQCSLMQIDEIHPHQEKNTLFINSSNEVFAPMHPIKITDFEIPDTQEVQLKFLSPTMLSKYYTAFSFNYVTERILKRALSMQALFCKSNIYWTEKNTVGNFQLYKFQKDDLEKNAILFGAQHIITQDISVNYTNKYHQSPNVKNNLRGDFEFYGYCGHVNYSNQLKNINLIQTFVPLLRLAEYINIGDKIRYGNGWVKCLLYENE